MLWRLRACSRSQVLKSLSPPLKEPSFVGSPSRNGSFFIGMSKALILFSSRHVCWTGQPLLIQQQQVWKAQYLWHSCILQLERKKEKYTPLDQQKANMLPLSVSPSRWWGLMYCPSNNSCDGSYIKELTGRESQIASPCNEVQNSGTMEGSTAARAPNSSSFRAGEQSSSRSH